jgi:hypothetical protein
VAREPIHLTLLRKAVDESQTEFARIVRDQPAVGAQLEQFEAAMRDNFAAYEINLSDASQARAAYIGALFALAAQQVDEHAGAMLVFILAHYTKLES